MNRFLSSQTKKIDAKGRVSVPAIFRTVMARQSIEDLYGFQDFLYPAFCFGGPDILDRYERQISTLDPFSPRAQQLSLLIHGGGSFFRLDGEGRLMITDLIRDYANLSDEVTFVGRSDHFQLWEPLAFQRMQDAARAQIASAGATG
ncbi:transcriptional regulator MraZ [Rhizobium albus]|nr:transcriptional regulator MraZ [Rhizobium albus]